MNDISRRGLLGLTLAAPLAALATRASAANHKVTIQGFKFQPAQLNVAAGDTVTFVNMDGAPHTATARDGAFDTGRLNKGQSASVTVPAGSHAFACQFHPNMTGTISAS